jgi:hypothetical protein
MQPDRPRSKTDTYREFIDFVRQDLQRERMAVHRRMFNVFVWCFALPAAFTIALLVLIKLHWLPRTARAYLEWMVLIFPVCYSLYVLSSEVVAQMPVVLRRGGLHGTLGQALKEAEWRERTRESMERAVQAAPGEWPWIVESFRVDLRALQYRTRYLTVLAGAVFFLIMEGIDSLGGAALETSVSWVRNPITGWTETSTYDVSQFIGLTLFLVLLYLSGNQSYQALLKYLDCAELSLKSPPPERLP